MWTEEDYQSGQNISRTKSITAVILENLGMLLSSSASLIYRCYKVIYYYVVVKRKIYRMYWYIYSKWRGPKKDFK